MNGDRFRGPPHLEVPELRELISRWPVMWRIEVPNIGKLTAYGAPCCIVHIIDYFDGGFDVYTPPTQSDRIDETVAALKRAALVSTKGNVPGVGLCMAKHVEPGDRILMPDEKTWLPVVKIRDFGDGERIFLCLHNGSLQRAPNELVAVHKKGSGTP